MGENASFKKVYWSYIIPIVVGFLFATADQFIKKNGYFEWYDSAYILKLILFICSFVLLFRYFGKKYMKYRTLKANALSYQEKKNICKNNLLKTWIILVITWLPTYILLFPGVVEGDSSIMIIQALSGDGFRDWHPFLETFLFGWFAAIGGKNVMLGVGIYCTLLMVISSLAVAYIISYCTKIVGDGISAKLIFCIFALPIAPITFMRMDKDGLFSLVFMLFCLLYCELYKSRLKFLYSSKFVLLLTIVSILTCLTKKTGVYIVTASFLILGFVKAKKKLKYYTFLLGVLFFVLIQIVIPSYLFPIINVEKGPISEGMAIPIQQVAKVYCMYQNDFDQADKEILNDIISIGCDNISENYDDYLVDPIKGMGINNSSSIGAFMKIWLRELIKHPWTYICTEIGLESGWVSFNNHYGYPNVYERATDSAVCNSMAPQIEWPQPSQRNELYQNIYQTIVAIPIINIFFLAPIWATIVPSLLLFLILYTRKFENIILVAPLILSMLLLWICPVSTHLRYAIPMYFIEPIFFSVFVYLDRSCKDKFSTEE